MFQLSPAQWPGRVIPELDEHIDTAVTAFCLRTLWADADQSKIRSVLVPWFDAGWCVDAVLAAVDRQPDGARQPTKGRDEPAEKFLKDRLRAWFNDDPNADSSVERSAPPVPGMTFGNWWRINRRNAQINRSTNARDLTTKGKEARDQALTVARSRRRDPVDRVREREARRTEALDSLLTPGAVPPSPEDSRRLVRLRSNSRQVCHYVARRELVMSDPNVLRAVEIVANQGRSATQHSMRALYRAVRSARQQAELATLEAMSRPPSVPARTMSANAQRIMHYLELAIEEELSFDSMVCLLIQNAAEPPTIRRNHVA